MRRTRHRPAGGGDVARVEAGLRPAVTIAGQPPVTRSLTDEMRRLHVPGVSIAVLRAGRIAWAKGYDVTQAGRAPVIPVPAAVRAARAGEYRIPGPGSFAMPPGMRG